MKKPTLCTCSVTKPMGFGTELQSQQSHEALLRLQDAEIRLLECMKKCLTQRIKCDRDYALALTQMVNIAQKVEQAEFSQNPVFLVSQLFIMTMWEGKYCCLTPGIPFLSTNLNI